MDFPIGGVSLSPITVVVFRYGIFFIGLPAPLAFLSIALALSSLNLADGELVSSVSSMVAVELESYEMTSLLLPSNRNKADDKISLSFSGVTICSLAKKANNTPVGEKVNPSSISSLVGSSLIVGNSEGSSVIVGKSDGWSVIVGSSDGSSLEVGDSDGSSVDVGCSDGSSVGFFVGVRLGFRVGSELGDGLGAGDGPDEGVLVGAAVGLVVGMCVGRGVDGNVGLCVG